MGLTIICKNDNKYNNDKKKATKIKIKKNIKRIKLTP